MINKKAGFSIWDVLMFFYSRTIADKTNLVIGIDRNPNYVHKPLNDSNQLLLHDDVEYLPFKDRYFDNVLCIDIIEQVENDITVLSEIGRVFRREGQLVLSVPNLIYPFTLDLINSISKPINKQLPIGIWGFGHKKLYSVVTLESILSQYRLKALKNCLSNSLFYKII